MGRGDLGRACRASHHLHDATSAPQLLGRAAAPEGAFVSLCSTPFSAQRQQGPSTEQRRPRNRLREALESLWAPVSRLQQHTFSPRHGIRPNIVRGAPGRTDCREAALPKCQIIDEPAHFCFGLEHQALSNARAASILPRNTRT